MPSVPDKRSGRNRNRRFDSLGFVHVKDSDISPSHWATDGNGEGGAQVLLTQRGLRVQSQRRIISQTS